MRKQCVIGFLIFTTACSPATFELTSTPSPTATRLIPTSVPATATETITPSPTFTHEPPPRFFTEEFDNAPEHWSTLYASGDSSRVEVLNIDSALTFELYSPNTWIYAIYGAIEYESVHIEAQIESRGSDTNYMGLVCNYNEQDGWLEFNISSDGTYNLLYGQWLADGIATYMPIANDPSEYIHVGDGTNELGLDCLDGILQLYINSKLFRKVDVSRFGLNGGKIGLSVASFSELPVVLAFEWVKVGQP